MSAWAIEQLNNIAEVAEGERQWFATHHQAGNLSEIPYENVEKHATNLSKIRDLALALAEHLDGSPRPKTLS